MKLRISFGLDLGQAALPTFRGVLADYSEDLLATNISKGAVAVGFKIEKATAIVTLDLPETPTSASIWITNIPTPLFRWVNISKEED